MKKILFWIVFFVFAAVVSGSPVLAQSETPWGNLEIYSGFNKGTAVVLILNPERALTQAIIDKTHSIGTEVICDGKNVKGTIENVKPGNLFLTFEHECSTEPQSGFFIWEENGVENRLELKFGEKDTDAATVIVPEKTAQEEPEGMKIQIDSDNGKRTLDFNRYVLSQWDMKVWINGAYENIPKEDGAPVKPFDIEAVCDGETVASKASQYDKTENTFVFRVDCTGAPSEIYVVYMKNGKPQRTMIYGRRADAGNQVETEPSGGNEENSAVFSDAPAAYAFENVDSNYREVYDELLKGERIQNGTQSETVRAIQSFFNEFGFKLPLTGGFYNQSLGALQTIEETFGMKKTDYIDSDVFAALVPKLLYYKAALREIGSDSADDSTPGFIDLAENLNPETGGPDRAYLEAAAFEMAEAYYQAYQRFSESSAADANARMENCVQPWPRNGEIYRDPNYYGSNTELVIKIGKDENIGAVIKIIRKNKTVSTLFLGRGESVTAYLAGGTYQIKVGMGEKWFGLRDTFGKLGSYETLTFDEAGNETVTLNAGYVYTLRINSGEYDPTADQVDSEYESYEDF